MLWSHRPCDLLNAIHVFVVCFIWVSFGIWKIINTYNRTLWIKTELVRHRIRFESWAHFFFEEFTPPPPHIAPSSFLICKFIVRPGKPSNSDSKASAWNAGDLGFKPGSGRSSGEGNGNPLQCSCLENPMDRGGWWATVHGVARSWTWLSD